MSRAATTPGWPGRARLLLWAWASVSLALILFPLAATVLPRAHLGAAGVAVAFTLIGAMLGAGSVVWRGAAGFEALRRNVERRRDDPDTPPPSRSILRDVYALPFRCANATAWGATIGGAIGLAGVWGVHDLGLRTTLALAAMLAATVGFASGSTRRLLNVPRRRITAQLLPEHVPRTGEDAYSIRVASAARSTTVAYFGCLVALSLGTGLALEWIAVGIGVFGVGAGYTVRRMRREALQWDRDLADVNRELFTSLGGTEGTVAELPHDVRLDSVIASPVEQVEARTRRGTELRHSVLALHGRYRDLLSGESTASEAAAETQRLKTRFMAYMSHDLRNPLNVVMGFSDLLGADTQGLNAEQRDSVRLIRDAAAELLRVVAEILDSARIEAGQLDMRPEYGAVPAILTASLAAANKATATAGASFDTQLEAGLPAVHVDVQRTEQALVALLVHVARTSERGSPVRVSARSFRGPSDSDVHVPRVRVEIAGRGMNPPADADSVFEPFHWRRPESGRHRRGLGYGLSLARSLLELQGAEVGFDREADDGGRFWVLLPVRPERPTAPPPETSQSTSPGGVPSSSS